jgi:hypothetical protein
MSQEQLVAEVGGIYTSIVSVESRYVEVDNTELTNRSHQQPAQTGESTTGRVTTEG